MCLPHARCLFQSRSSPSVPSVPFAPLFSDKEKAFLQLLHKKNSLSVKEFVKGVTGNKENQLRSEFHYLSKKLEQQEFVHITHHAGKVLVTLTSFGEIYACE